MPETGFQLAGSAPDHYERFVAPIMVPFVAALVAETAPSPGEAVLDVACGTGFVARAAAARVGATGRVVGADPNGPMLATAARTSAGTEPPIAYVEAPAGALPLPDADFDVVLCQQGVQFFPDLAGALTEMSRVLKPGGRFAATAWSPRERSPFFAAQYRAVLDLAGPEAAALMEPAYALPGDRLAEALAAAGLRDVAVREVVADVALPPVREYAAQQLGAVPWGLALFERGPEAVAAAAARIAGELAPYADPSGGVTVPFASVLATARR